MLSLALLGVGHHGETLLQVFTISYSLIPILLYFVFAVNFQQSFLGALARTLRNVLLSVLLGFIITIITANSYSNAAWYNNMDFLTTHIVVIWFFEAMTVVSVFSYEFRRRELENLRPTASPKILLRP